MATPTISLPVPEDVQKSIVQYQRNCWTYYISLWDMRAKLTQNDLAYQREKDLTAEQAKARRANQYGDSTKYQNYTVPIVMPAVEAAVTYQTSVYLQGTPIFGVVSDAANQDQATAMETVIDDQARKGGWTRELIMTFRDAFKHNISFVEVDWKRQVSAAVESDITFAGGAQGKPVEVIWQGNRIRRLDPYNVFFDTRVSPSKLSEYGEFAGFTELMSRVRLKAFLNELPTKLSNNEKPAFETGLGGAGFQMYMIPNINPDSLQPGRTYTDFDWYSWAGISEANPFTDARINYRGAYEVTTLYARIMPSDFNNWKVPAPNTPQIWKFIIVNSQVLVYAERQTNAHNRLPIMCCVPYDDGLDYQTKSLLDNIKPVQEISTAMINSALASRRRAISDRGLYDPSRVSEANINSANPSAKIPVKPAAYGLPLNEAYYPIPFNDNQSGVIFQEIGQLAQYANQITGQNPARQGQFVKGNKTLHEFDTIMANANSRDQMVALLMEDQFFTPLKEILKINILQYQAGTQLFNSTQKQTVTVDPLALRKTVMAFKVSDGLTPTDRLISSDALQSAFQVMAQAPTIGQDYNMPDMFAYLMSTQGADLKQFKKDPNQVAYENAAQQWQQLAMMVAQKGGDISKIPPQPTPQQFGWDPNAPKNTDQVPAVQSIINPADISQASQAVNQSNMPNAPDNTTQPAS